MWAEWAANGWFDGRSRTTRCSSRELGRALVPGPYVATVAAARMADAAGDRAREPPATTSRPAGPSWPWRPRCTRASRSRCGESDAGEARVSGRFRVFDEPVPLDPHPPGRGRRRVPARERWAPHRGRPPVDRPAGRNRDPRPRGRARLQLDRPWPPFVEGALLVAAMASGIAEATLGASTEFAKVREQFGSRSVPSRQ